MISPINRTHSHTGSSISKTEPRFRGHLKGDIQYTRWGYRTYLGWFGTYPTGLHNVSGVVRNVSDGVRNRVDASLDVSVGVVQRIWGGPGRIRRGCTTYPLGLCNVSGVVRDVSDGVAQRIRWGYATYPTGFGTGSEGFGGGRSGFGTGSTRRWTYPTGLHNVSVGVMQRIRLGSEPGRRGSEVVGRGSEPGRCVVGRICWGCTTYLGWFGTYPLGLCNVSDGVQDRIRGVRRWYGAPTKVVGNTYQGGCYHLYRWSVGPPRWYGAPTRVVGNDTIPRSV